MKLETRRFNDLSITELQRLHGLTNGAGRTDLRDDGTQPGSVFRRMLDDRIMGEDYPNVHIVLVKNPPKLVGWALMTIHRSGIDPVTGKFINKAAAQVGFYVNESYRRQGLASDLFQALCETARKNNVARLIANPWNKASHSFFNKNGFILFEHHLHGAGKTCAVLEL